MQSCQVKFTNYQFQNPLYTTRTVVLCNYQYQQLDWTGATVSIDYWLVVIATTKPTTDNSVTEYRIQNTVVLASCCRAVMMCKVIETCGAVRPPTGFMRATICQIKGLTAPLISDRRPRWQIRRGGASFSSVTRLIFLTKKKHHRLAWAVSELRNWAYQHQHNITVAVILPFFIVSSIHWQSISISHQLSTKESIRTMATSGTPMYVIKRDGSRASVSFDKITSRITKLCYGLDPKVSHCVALCCVVLHCIVLLLCYIELHCTGYIVICLDYELHGIAALPYHPCLLTYSLPPNN